MCKKNRHFIIIVVFLYTFLAVRTPLLAIELNFIDTQLLRMKNSDSPLEVINPFATAHPKKTIGGNLDVIGNNEIYPFYQDISSKNQKQILNRLENSFGKPYSFLGKTNLYIKSHYEDSAFTQVFHTDIGGSFFLTDPVFPEVKTLLFQNNGGKSELNFFHKKEYEFNISVNYGYLRLIRQELNVGDLVDSKPSFKLKERPWDFYLLLNLDSKYNFFNLVDIIIKVNAVPIVKEKYKLFNSFIGVTTTNLLPSDFTLFDYVRLSAGYSPLYKGNYYSERTFILNSGVGFNDWIQLNVFAIDQMYIGGDLKLGSEKCNVSLYTYKESYDDYGIYTFRNYGLNLNLNF